MNNFKKLLVAGALTIAVSTTGITAFAVSAYKTPAEAVAGVTGKTVSDVITQREETGKTYGTIASEAGKLDEFKTARLEIMKDNVDARVTSGTLTQEQADEIYNNMKENQVNCDGTGNLAGNQNKVNGSGNGSGKSVQGNGNRMGNGICQSSVPTK
jgi:hypothetical protein